MKKKRRKFRFTYFLDGRIVSVQPFNEGGKEINNQSWSYRRFMIIASALAYTLVFYQLIRMLGSHSEAFWETTPSFSLQLEREGEGVLGVFSLSVGFHMHFIINYMYIKDKLPFGF
jgi:hypothetical protein